VPAQPMRLTRILASPAQVLGARDPAMLPLAVLVFVDHAGIPPEHR
jgi:hypothetical protein